LKRDSVKESTSLAGERNPRLIIRTGNGERAIARSLAAPNLRRRKAMNQDQFKGRWNQFKGELKKKWGELTDDDLLQIEGNYDEFMGTVQKRYGDRKQEVSKWADQWFQSDQPARPGV
jgi:uncharacterized protein YjbJ (UPF0337 family)